MTLPQLVLLLIGVVTAALTIRARMRGDKSGEYIVKPLSTILIIVVALIAPDPVSREYHVLIVLGLIASLAGDIALMLDDRYFIAGLVSFLIAHLFYIAAFTREGDGTASLLYVIPFVIYAGVMLRILWPHLGSLRGPVILYMAVILMMGWQALNRWIETEQSGAILALIGAYLFIASDSVLAIERFRGSWRSAPFWVLSTYWAAQALIALSI